MTSCYLNSMSMISTLGSNSERTLEQLQSDIDTFTLCQKFHDGDPLPLGKVTEALPGLPLDHPKWQSRNNQIAWLLAQKLLPQINNAIRLYGANRIGVIIGTSTSGIGDSDEHFKVRHQTGILPETYHYGIQEMGATSAFLANALGVSGPNFSISTACSSGAKALASARRFLRSGLCDVVIAGGVDSLCKLTVQGFSSLEAVSNDRCNPFSSNRKGINIGEGGGLFVVSKEKGAIELAGVGESSDAHHISAPDPTGAGAINCMTKALSDANITPSDIDYVNLHGTATSLNDQMESKAIASVFQQHPVLCSSTKPFTGHTLGAAGAIEAAICWLALTHNVVPKHLWDEQQDTSLPVLNFSKGENNVPLNYALSNSFAFGGNNISLILRKVT